MYNRASSAKQELTGTEMIETIGQIRSVTKAIGMNALVLTIKNLR